jgi:hypothetical protein
VSPLRRFITVADTRADADDAAKAPARDLGALLASTATDEEAPIAIREGSVSRKPIPPHCFPQRLRC